MKKIYTIIISFFFINVIYSQQLEATWDQGIPFCPEDKYISNLIDKLGDGTLKSSDSITDASNLKIFREIGFAFYDKGMYEAADWYLKRAKKYKEKVEIEKSKPKPSEQDIKKMESDLKFLNDLPKSYENLSKDDMVKLAKIIDKKIKELSNERDSLLKTKNPNQELITTKNSSIKTLAKEKDVIKLTIKQDELKTETKGLKNQTRNLKIYLWWLVIGVIILILFVVALLQRKTIKIKDSEIDKQLDDINKKNKYLEYSARIIRHDMHSGINTYIPRGISSLEKRISVDDIENLKIGPSIKMIKEGLNHTQKVYKRVYEFTNLVKQQVVLDKTNVDIKIILDEYFSNTSYKEQVEISKLMKLDVNPTLFCNAIDNLVKNGLQYNDSKDKLVKIYSDSDYIIIEDNGRGLKQKDLKSAIGKYLNKKGDTESGLGLSISKTILEEHGFELSCDDVVLGTKIKIKIKN